jgi:hypothetical protein
MHEIEELLIVNSYLRCYRKPNEGTIGAAVEIHAQTCGIEGYVFGVNTNTVARLVAKHYEENKRDNE